VPDIYDTIRHDLRKNSLIFKKIDQDMLDRLHDKARTLAHFVVINEYGIKDEERLRIAQDICLPLIEKMKVDLMFWREKSSEDLLWKYRNNA
jgi:inositol hexakisphosphate/diphosphoinositol-pentakisphosphate kinase